MGFEGMEHSRQFPEIYPEMRVPLKRKTGTATDGAAGEGSGPTLSLRLTKQEGVPVRVTRDGEAGDAVIAVRRVNDTDVYTLGRNDLATKLKISQFETSALIQLLGVQADPESYKIIKIGSQAHKRYSMKALDVLAKAKAAGRIGEAVKQLKARRGGSRENRT